MDNKLIEKRMPIILNMNKYVSNLIESKLSAEKSNNSQHIDEVLDNLMNKRVYIDNQTDTNTLVGIAKNLLKWKSLRNTQKLVKGTLVYYNNCYYIYLGSVNGITYFARPYGDRVFDLHSNMYRTLLQYNKRLTSNHQLCKFKLDDVLNEGVQIIVLDDFDTSYLEKFIKEESKREKILEDKKKNSVYGQLYKLNAQLHRKSLNSIWLDDSYIILNENNESEVKREGYPVEISQDVCWEYISNLFTDTVYGLLNGKDTNKVLNNIINNKVPIVDSLSRNGLSLQIPTAIITNANIFKNMRATRNQQKISKGSLICCPGQKNEFWLYLGSDLWFVPAIGYNKGSWSTVLTSGLVEQLKEQLNKLDDKRIIYHNRVEILNSGVLVTKMDLSNFNLK